MDDDLTLGRLLAAATRLVIDDLHAALAEQGHPGLRPAHGYALLAVGDEGTTTARLGERLGMTKQGAAKLVASLEELGYLERRADDADGRARRLVLTRRGRDLLRRSAAAQRAIEDRWAEALGPRAMQSLRRSLERMVQDAGPAPVRPVW